MIFDYNGDDDFGIMSMETLWFMLITVNVTF